MKIDLETFSTIKMQLSREGWIFFPHILKPEFSLGRICLCQDLNHAVKMSQKHCPHKIHYHDKHTWQTGRP